MRLQIQGYEDLVEIGRGGFAVVYRARQPTFGRLVAIKVLSTPGLSEDDRGRFEREVLALGRMSDHPNIVAVYDAGITDTGHPYIAMEHLEGGSLGDRLAARGALDVPVVLTHGIRLASALDAAHRADLLHRDVKPDNVLIDAFGGVKLADFGVAAITGHTLTASGVITGTVAHAAPEILNGKRATPASDVYSLGSTLYELLAGTPAFVHPDDESMVVVAIRVMTGNLPDLRNESVPDAVASAIEQAMAHEPDDRPGPMALAALLQDAQRSLGEPVTEIPIRSSATGRRDRPALAPIGGNPARHTGSFTGARSTPLRAIRWRRPAALGLVLGLALTVGAFALGRTTGGDAGSPTTTAPEDPVSTEPQVTDSIRLDEGPHAVAFGAGQVWVTNGNADTVTNVQRGTPLRLLDTIDLCAEAEDLAPCEALEGVAVAEGGVWVAAVNAEGIFRVDASTNRVTDHVRLGRNPGSTGIAYGDGALWVTNDFVETVSRVDPATKEVTATVEARGPAIAAGYGAVWVADSGNGMVRRVDPATNTVTDTIPVGQDPFGIAAGAGAVWVTNSVDGTVSRIDPDTRLVVETIPVDGPADGVAVGADGVWVLVNDDTGDARVLRVDPETNEVADTVEMADTFVDSIAFGAGVLWVTGYTDTAQPGDQLFYLDPDTR